jgi:hypothetical protein
MKNLFETATLSELERRLSQLTTKSEGQWGHMNVAQMLAHCSEWIEMASGRKLPRRTWVGRIFGRFAKASFLSEKPLPRNIPSDKSLIVDGQRDFAVECQRLAVCMERFTAGGPHECTQHPHPFFGPLTATEWAILAYKHLDHHFRQFGV